MNEDEALKWTLLGNVAKFKLLSSAAERIQNPQRYETEAKSSHFRMFQNVAIGQL